MKLSIFIAGYRAENWLSVYNSVSQATVMQDYEIVFVGPNEPSKEVLDIPNIRFIQDFGCPSRCYQLGLLHSKGEYVVWAADDGVFSPTLAIDKAFEILPNHHKGIVAFKYYEAPFDCPKYNKKSKKKKAVQKRAEKQFLESDTYWHMYGHLMRDIQFIQNHYVLLMIALMRRDYLMEIGGFDCQYEQPGIGCHDLAVRLQNDGAEVVLGEKIMDISNSPSEHGPIDIAQNQNDLPLLQSMYNDPAFESRTNIPVDNWKQVPDVWPRRFPGGKAST